MNFKQEPDNTYHCFDWCDLEDGETIIAIIERSKEDLYWRANIVYNRPLSCGHLKRLADKVSELNKG